MKDEILRIMRLCGIEDAGFCAFCEVKEHLLPCRAKNRLPADAATVIVCVFPYKVREQRPRCISRYAAVPDYHRVCGAFLQDAAERLRARFPQNRFEPFIDNSPIPEVYAAASAGLGVYGQNGLLLTPQYGSWVFLGEIVTDLVVPCQNRFQKCPGCGACKRVCPKENPGAECLSAVSQQKKELTAEQRSAMQRYDILWGCDLCAESCPMNRGAETSYIKEFSDGYRDCYMYGEDIKGRAYEWRDEAVIVRNFKNLKK